jgi:hypothetical protein
MRIYIKDKTIYEGQARSTNHGFATILPRFAYVLSVLYSVFVTSLAAILIFTLQKRIRRFTWRAAVLDTVGIWGSNPHAPTISINTLAQPHRIFCNAKLHHLNSALVAGSISLKRLSQISPEQ